MYYYHLVYYYYLDLESIAILKWAPNMILDHNSTKSTNMHVLLQDAPWEFEGAVQVETTWLLLAAFRWVRLLHPPPQDKHFAFEGGLNDPIMLLLLSNAWIRNPLNVMPLFPLMETVTLFPGLILPESGKICSYYKTHDLSITKYCYKFVKCDDSMITCT